MVRLVIGIGDVDFQLAEAAAEGGELIRVQRLAREAQHPCSPRARRIARKSLFDIGRARSMPVMVAPSVSPPGVMSIGIS